MSSGVGVVLITWLRCSVLKALLFENMSDVATNLYVSARSSSSRNEVFGVTAPVPVALSEGAGVMAEAASLVGTIAFRFLAILC